MLQRNGSVLSFASNFSDIGINMSNSRHGVNNSEYFGTGGAQSSFDGRYSRAVTHPRSSHDGFTKHVRS